MCACVCHVRFPPFLPSLLDLVGQDLRPFSPSSSELPFFSPTAGCPATFF